MKARAPVEWGVGGRASTSIEELKRIDDAAFHRVFSYHARRTPAVSTVRCVWRAYHTVGNMECAGGKKTLSIVEVIHSYDVTTFN